MQFTTQSNEVVTVVAELVQALVDDSEEVMVRAVDGQRTTLLELTVAPEDLGKVLGRGGRTIAALRRVLVGISGAQQRRYSLSLLESDPLDSPDGSRNSGPGMASQPPKRRSPFTTPEMAVSATERLLTGLLRLLVDEPSAVRVRTLEGRQVTIFEVSVAPLDTRRIIGVRGRQADAIRVLLSNIAARHHRSFHLEIVEPVSTATPPAR